MCKADMEGNGAFYMMGQVSVKQLVVCARQSVGILQQEMQPNPNNGQTNS